MSQTILLRRSSVANKVPTPAQLSTGELAINTFDGKLYLKKDNGTQSIREIGGDPFPVQAGLDGMFLKTNGSSVYWSDTGGTATRVPQAGHSLALGDIVRFTGSIYVKAVASDESTADVIGIVTAVFDANTFELTTSGVVEFPASITYTPGAPYFLSPTTAGALTTTEPTAYGHISKPLFIALTAHSGLFYNWRGIEITKQIEIDDMLPSQTGHANHVLMSDGTSSGWISVAAATASTSIVTANSYVVGQVVRAVGTSFTLAQANNATNAQVYGIISYASPTEYTITTSGLVNGLSGLVAGTMYYLSDVTAGGLVATEPTATTSISKPIFIATSATSGVFYNQRGLSITTATATAAQLLPSMAGQSTKFLTNNGATANWATIPTTSTDIVNTIGATYVQNANYSTNSGNSNTLDGLDSTQFWKVGGNQDVDIANPNASASCAYASIELRECNHGGAYDGNIAYAPRLGFHWAGRVASQLGMEASGRLAVLNNPGTGYENLVCATLYGRATSANYADLAEKYEADADYAPGTVLAIGGDKEVTLSVGYMDNKVVGIVSTNPAYLMNDECAGEFVAAVALTGRAPCRVSGVVKKGDMLVSAGDGTARASADGVVHVGCVIGKALADFDGAATEGVIEVLVGKH